MPERRADDGALKPIPLFKVAMSEEAVERVGPVLRSGYIGQGKECEEFEREFQNLVGAPRRPLLVNSGTSALTLALDLCGVRPGDYVISTPQTCTATNTPIVNLGANILWADIDPETGLIDPQSVAEIVNQGRPETGGHGTPKAIIAVDWGGMPCDYKALKSFGIPVIEDAAHRVRLAENHGSYVAWSYQAIKFLTCGDGGALLCPGDKTHAEAKLLRWYGLDRESSTDFRCAQSIKRAGWKFQSNDIAAAIGRGNLSQVIDRVNAARRNSIRLALECKNPAVRQPRFGSDVDPWLHTVLVQDRDGFIAHMKARGIAASPVHRRNDEHDCFARFRRPLPGVDAFSSQNVAIPNGWWLTGQDLDRVIEAVNAW